MWRNGWMGVAAVTTVAITLLIVGIKIKAINTANMATDVRTEISRPKTGESFIIKK